MKMVSPKSLSDAYCDMEYCRDTADGVIVNVKAQPRSSRSGIDGVLGNAVKVRIKSAPVDGKANKELIETVADAFDLPKSRVRFLCSPVVISYKYQS